MMGVVGAWRYRNKVLSRVDFIFSSMGPTMGKMVLRSGMPNGGWKRAIRSYYDQGVSPDEGAAIAALMSLSGAFAHVKQDDRDLALFALRNGNRANSTANHLRSILSGIGLYGSDTIAKAATFEVIGILEGRSGEDLNEYRQARLLDDTLRSTPFEATADLAREVWQRPPA